VSRHRFPARGFRAAAARGAVGASRRQSPACACRRRSPGGLSAGGCRAPACRDQGTSQWQAARAAHDQKIRTLETEVRDHNAAVDELGRDFLAGVPDAVEDYFTQVLALSQCPADFPRQYAVAYRPAACSDHGPQVMQGSRGSR